jgi:hypothetical protein
LIVSRQKSRRENNTVSRVKKPDNTKIKNIDHMYVFCAN